MATFDFTAGRILPFYWEPCDWCGLTSVDIPATNHPKFIRGVWKLQSHFLECQKAVHQVCMGMWHLVILPFGLWVMTDPLFCHPKNPMIPSKILITRHYSAKLQTTKQTLTTSKHSIEFTYSDFPCSDFPCHFIVNRDKLALTNRQRTSNKGKRLTITANF